MLRLVYESLGAGGLLLVAYLAWSGRQGGPLRARHFSVVAAVGSLMLAFDEAFNVHELLGSALYERGWREPAGINHFDDVLVFGLALAGIATAAFFAREIVREPRFAALFGAAVALFLAAIAWDSIADPTRTHSWWTEETLELAGVVVMVVAFRDRAAWLREDDGVLMAGAASTGD